MNATCHRPPASVNNGGMIKPLKPASSVILAHEGKYLLVRRANPPAADMYAFPGGRAEPGETAEETARRELFEETALEGENFRLFATYELPGKEGDFLLSVFLADCRDITPMVAQDDAAEAGWYTVAEVSALPVPQSVRDCIERLVQLQN